MILRSLIFCLAVTLIVTTSCNLPSAEPQGQVTEPYISDSDSVGFNIEPLQSGSSAQQWLATYNSQGKTARFRIELGKTRASESKEPVGFDTEFGEGKFIAEPGSDASVLLADLKKALQAKTLPIQVQKVASLPFTFVTFGHNQSQASGGGFTPKPPGNWTPMKIFLGKGDQEAEVFLNLNPIIKKGQFSIKDADYGDSVLAQLARVL
jgi:hypothetical protein